jgi:hypothetical protein
MFTRRRGIVYGINVVHPSTGRVMLGYVGQTRQTLEARETQHREVQPWADTIVGRAYVIEVGWWTDVELDAREVWHIHRWLPLYNIEHNMANPWRIPPWTAVEQRQAREPGWRPVRHQTFVAMRAGRRVPWRVYGIATMWLVLTAVLWWAADWTDLPFAAGTAAVAMVSVRVWRWWRRSQRPQRRRR